MDAEEIENTAVPTINEYMGTPIYIIRTGLLNTKKDNRKIIIISVHPSTPTIQYERGETQIEKKKETEKEKIHPQKRRLGRQRQRQNLKNIKKKSQDYSKYLDNLDLQNNNNIENIVKNTCLRTFGFNPDPNLNVHQNTNIIVGNSTPYNYLIKPSNATFHNLCNNISLPNGITGLISLGLKFCLEKPKPISNLSNSNYNLTRSIRIDDWFKLHSPKEPIKYIL